MNPQLHKIAEVILDAYLPDVQLFQTELLRALAASPQASTMAAWASANPTTFTNLTRALSVLIRHWTRRTNRRGSLVGLLVDQLEMLPADIRRAFASPGSVPQTRHDSPSGSVSISDLLSIVSQLNKLPEEVEKSLRATYCFLAEISQAAAPSQEDFEAPFPLQLAASPEEVFEKAVAPRIAELEAELQRPLRTEERALFREITTLYFPTYNSLCAEQARRALELVREGKFDPLWDIDNETITTIKDSMSRIARRSAIFDEVLNHEELAALTGVLHSWTESGRSPAYIRLLAHMIDLLAS